MVVSYNEDKEMRKIHLFALFMPIIDILLLVGIVLLYPYSALLSAIWGIILTMLFLAGFVWWLVLLDNEPSDEYWWL